MKIIKEFREFAVKGNVFDMAIGIIIGSAFGKIVSSLVQDILMPPFGILLGTVDFTNWNVVLRPVEIGTNGTILNEAVVIRVGKFISVCLDFLLVAVSIFLVIQAINRLKRKAEDDKIKEVPMPKDIQLLTEIRDELRKRNT